MNWTELFSALALVLIIEGIIPFINPLGYKKTMQQMLAMPESTLRAVGLSLMLVGALSLFFIRG
jgi:uncharacterized protein YjeT (DUF2065 family)|tara:strand:- start:1182 stop:1373 length:192 start_codon:yes stop_codon:yes gene_type:complete